MRFWNTRCKYEVTNTRSQIRGCKYDVFNIVQLVLPLKNALLRPRICAIYLVFATSYFRTSYLWPRISEPRICDLILSLKKALFGLSKTSYTRSQIRGSGIWGCKYEVTNTRSQIRGHKYEVFQFRTTRITPQKGIITTSYLHKYDRICANTRSAEPRIGGFFANTTLHFGKGPYWWCTTSIRTRIQR